MPIFDVQCGNGHTTEFIGSSAQITETRCHCGASVERLFTVGRSSVISDAIPGGEVIENLAATPVTFYSRSEKRQYMQQHGIREHVQHVGTPGGDKSPHTTRWV